MQKTLIDYFYEKEKNWADRPYLHQPFGDQWETYTWAEVGDKARRLATWLKSQCPKEKAHISIVSKNCREWVIADIAIMMAGFISVPFYPNLRGKELAEVVDLGDTDLLLFGKVEGWENMKTGVPENIAVGKFPHYENTPLIDIGTDWEEMMQCKPLQGNDTPDLEDIWSIIFTSGTTGSPKGAYFKHGKVGKVIESPHIEKWSRTQRDGNNKYFSYLPLNHIAERHQMVLSIGVGAEFFFYRKPRNVCQKSKRSTTYCFLCSTSHLDKIQTSHFI